MSILLFRIAAVLCFLAVALGAFGAHGLRSTLEARGMLDVWNKAVFYHFIHAIAVVVFIGSFFVALGIGRFLKRRAGVQLGLFFRLFCLILAFYAAIAAYGVHAPWRYHVGAAAIFLSTALIVSLVNRYVWDLYFEKKQQTAIPHFLRDVVGGVIFLIVLLVILSYGYHAETQLKGLLAGSGVVAIIVGFAGQNLF